MSLLYRNQLIDLLYKSIDWFLYGRDIGRQKGLSNTISLSGHEQVCLMRLRFKSYFSHHRKKAKVFLCIFYF